jgi:hypothetical protein
MHIEFAFMICISLYTAIQLLKYLLYVKPVASDKPCYTISAPEGHSIIIQDSEYIIDRIGYYVGQGSKNGLCDIDILIDLRYTKTSSVYRAIGVIEDNGIVVQEKQSRNPMQLIFNIRFNNV